MATAKGKVVKITANDSAYGTMYNVQVGSQTYGAGKYPPRFAEGDYIQFEYEEKGRFKNMMTKTVTKIDPVPEEALPAQQPGKTYSGRGGYNDDKRQDVISKQAARNTAIEFMKFLADQDALPVAKTAKAPDKFEAFNGILEKFTEDFYNYSTGKSSPSVSSANGDEVVVEQEPEGSW